jgi:hypothetical protein
MVISPKNKNTISAVTAQLFDIILKMSFEDRRTLLKDLMAKQDEAGRKFYRKNYLMSVEYAVHGDLYNGFISNISSGGVFIECPPDTVKRLSMGDPITLTFNHPDKKLHIKISGEIARLVDNGFGVSFDKLLHDLVIPEK